MHKKIVNLMLHQGGLKGLKLLNLYFLLYLIIDILYSIIYC